MLLNRVHISNFQSIRDLITIDLAPLTFFYGPNSAGKSAVADAIAVVGDVLSSSCEKETAANWIYMRGPDTRVTVGVGGRCIEAPLLDQLRPLGLQRLDTREGILPSSRLQPALAIAHQLFDAHLAAREDGSPPPRSIQLDVTIELVSLVLPNGTRTVRFDRLLIEVEDQPFAEINEGGRTVVVHLDHPAFGIGGSLHRFGEKLVRSVSDAQNAMPVAHRRFIRVENQHLAVSCLYTPINELALADRFTAAPVGFAPEGDSWWTYFADEADLAFYEYLRRGPNEELERELERVREYLCGFITIPARLAGAAACGLLRVGPLRDLPTVLELVDLPPPSAPVVAGRLFERPDNAWLTGRSAWFELAQSPEMVEPVNSWLVAPQRLDMGFEIRVADYSTNFASPPATLPPGYPQNDQHFKLIYLWDRTLQQPVAVADVGTGVSQVVPVLVATCGKHAAVFLEQPELHLHPRLVQALGDFFIAQRSRGLLMVETHSEHLALRLQRRIRETSESQIKHRDQSVSPEDVAFYYFEPKDGATRVHRLRVDSHGRFVDLWPDGFFAERSEDVFSVLDT